MRRYRLAEYEGKIYLPVEYLDNHTVLLLLDKLVWFTDEKRGYVQIDKVIELYEEMRDGALNEDTRQKYEFLVRRLKEIRAQALQEVIEA